MTLDNPRATIGGNNPPDPIDEALAPWSDTLTEAEAWADGEPVQNEGQMDAVDLLLKDIKAAKKDVGAARDEATKPLHAAWKAEIARWKPTLDDLDRMSKCLVAAIDPYKRKLAEEKRAAERKAWEEAQAAKRAAEEKAAQADAANIGAQREAEEAKRAAMEAEKAAQEHKRERVKGLRTVHRYEITDHRALLHWIAANDRDAVTAFIEAYAAKHHKAQAMDGVRVWTEKEAF